MLAAMNTPDGESVLEDINNIIFSVLDKPESRLAWKILEEMYYNGASEVVLYDEMSSLINQFKEEL